MDQATREWRQNGTVAVWRYVDESKNYAGWHLTADAAGCASLLQLIDLMRAAAYTAEQIVRLTPPTVKQLRAVGRATRSQAIQRWRIMHSKTKQASDFWQLASDESELTLTLGSARLDELRRGVEDVSRSNGDYCIGTAGQELWFW